MNPTERAIIDAMQDPYGVRAIGRRHLEAHARAVDAILFRVRTGYDALGHFIDVEEDDVMRPGYWDWLIGVSRC